MSNQTELDPRNQEAIESALQNNWEKAILLNKELLKDYPEDVNVLNRLGHAYAELGQVNKASSTYKQILEIDPYNDLAKRNLERLSTLRRTNLKAKEDKTPLDPDAFIEEPGKTKTISVVDLAMTKVLITLRIGDSVILSPSKKTVSVISENNLRLGKLEPYWGEQIAAAIALGSRFNAIVKAIKVGKDSQTSTLSIFVREIKRSPKLAHPIFPIDNNNFTPFVREETLNYIKEQDASLVETTDGTEEIPLEDLPTEEEETTEPPPIEIDEPLPKNIEDEEDFSPQ